MFNLLNAASPVGPLISGVVTIGISSNGGLSTELKSCNLPALRQVAATDACANERKPMMPFSNAVRTVYLSHMKMSAGFANIEPFYRGERMLDRVDLG
jgi:hypothetical protein